MQMELLLNASICCQSQKIIPVNSLANQGHPAFSFFFLITNYFSPSCFIHELGEKVRNPHESPGEQAVAGLLALLCILKEVRWLSD